MDAHAPASQLPRVPTLPFHALVLTTGCSADSDILSLHGPHLGTADALNNFHSKAAQAKSIVVCGGGCSGVEVAGQFATYLDYSRHFPFRRQVPNPKRITLISGGERCLPALAPKYGAQAERLLKGLGVAVKHGVRVTEAKEWSDQTGATRLDLTDDTQIVADLYVACTGVKPNSHYAPSHMKDEKGYILTNAASMRCDTAGVRIYSIGDIASYSQNSVPDVYAAVPVVMHNMLNDLLRYEFEPVAASYGGSNN
ncbi:hypothetical protein D0861_05039 [Lecanosticta acicola]|uniref:FAD/NAD(P)-binding domain-containing protein n=1 Tax=Lecanosticta acicola TaxID=111012 RepID=A0AAI8Z687_9PEZI|nr:hypothetical protein D0861_05039 [Lecanosticta acicola]